MPKVKEIVTLLLALDQELDIYMGIAGSGGQIVVEPVTKDCDDDTVIGYMIMDDGDKVN